MPLASSQVVPEANDTIRDYLRGDQGLVAWSDLSQTLHNFYLLKLEPYFWVVFCNFTDFHFDLNSVHSSYIFF